MARGRLLRTKVKEARKIAEATEIGKGIGQTKAHAKKPFMEELKEHIGKAIDRIDPLELAAVICLTPLVKTFVDTSVKVTQSMLTIGAVWFWGPFSAIFPQLIPQFETKNITSEELMKWGLAFAFSFCIVRWGDKLISAGVGDLTKLIGLATA